MALKALPTAMVIEKQSKVDSFMEALVNTGIGFGLAVATNAIVLPMMLGVKVSAYQSSVIAMIFTGTSIARSYLLRRAFNGRSVWQTLRSFAPHLLNFSFWVWLTTTGIDRRRLHGKRNTPCHVEPNKMKP